MAFQAKPLAPALNGDPFGFVTSITVLNKQGATYTVGTPSVTVTDLDDSGYVLGAYGATLPTAGDAGYSVGCLFRLTANGGAGTVFVNNGTTTSALFQGLSGSPASSAAINATATATAAQVATGRITSTSAAATTITLPTGTLLGAYLGATAGTKFDLIVDNTAGANTVTMAVATNGILSAAAAAGSSANFGLLTVPSGVTGVARFTLLFSSATAYVFSRTA